jgi:hypothetical protein
MIILISVSVHRVNDASNSSETAAIFSMYRLQAFHSYVKAFQCLPFFLREVAALSCGWIVTFLSLIIGSLKGLQEQKRATAFSIRYPLQ